MNVRPQVLDPTYHHESRLTHGGTAENLEVYSAEVRIVWDDRTDVYVRVNQPPDESSDPEQQLSECCTAASTIADMLAASPSLRGKCKSLCERVSALACALRRKGLGGWADEWLGDDILPETQAAIAATKVQSG